MVSASMPAPLKQLAALFGTRVTATIGRKKFDLLVFDFAKWSGRRMFITDLFGDCRVPGDYPDWISRKTPGGPTTWKHPTVVPFAMQDPMGDDDDRIVRPSQVHQFHVLWVTDVTRPGPVYGLDVDGGVTPARKAPVLVKNLDDVTFVVKPTPARPKSTAPSFDEAVLLQKLRGGMGPQSYDAWGLLDRLRGGKGESPKPPKNRDPRWANALRTEVLEAVHHGEGLDLIVAAWLSFSVDEQADARDLLVTLSERLARPDARESDVEFREFTNRLLRGTDPREKEAVFRLLESKAVKGIDSLLWFMRVRGSGADLPRLKKILALRGNDTQVQKVIELIIRRESEPS
jgi:hypothetical protein